MKSREDYYKDLRNKSGLQSYCTDCIKEQAKQYQAKNRERLLPYWRAYKKANPVASREANERYKKANPGANNAACRRYRARKKAERDLLAAGIKKPS